MSIAQFLNSNTTKTAGAMLLPFIGSFAGSLVTRNNIEVWYDNLKAPACKPPNAIFGPVWTALYCGMGYASYIVYKKGGGFSGAARLPLTLYAAQLALNWAWPPIFFQCHELKWVSI